jgi:DNA-binding PadR family transcriptional regulator
MLRAVKNKDDVRAHLPLKPVEFLVLAVLADGHLHGYGIVQEMEERTRGVIRIRPGDLYRVLYRLSERGLLKMVERKRPEGAEERRTYYGLTPFGKRVLRAEADLLSGIIAQVASSA